jgi:serine/threonine-protein kinase RsbW
MSTPSPSTERTLHASLPSNLTDYHDFIQSVLTQLAELGWGKCDLFAVNMALEESISNSIRHGNKEDLTKRVDVDCRFSERRFWVRICDEGEGFKPSDVPDCCAPDRLEVPGGRGLLLMQAYMTRVEYNDRGNCLTMEKMPGAPGSDPKPCCN